MIPRSMISRRQLEFHVFESTENQDWRLVIPSFYADLFSFEEPEILRKSNTGWRDSKNPRLKYAFFKQLTGKEVERIDAFLKAYEELIILDVNEHIEHEFGDELDFCVALGWPAEDPKELNKGKRSRIGELVYLAKYKRRIDKADELVNFLAPAMTRTIKGKVSGVWSISFVPSDNYEDFYLPKYLAEKLASANSIVQHLDQRKTFVEARILKKLDKLKNISIKAKLHICKELYVPEKLSLASSVSGLNIIVIDDLYQSGTTIWSYAKYLKTMGATSVFGLVCEKNFRDSDNL